MKNKIIILVLYTSLIILATVIVAAGGYWFIIQKYQLPSEVTQFLEEYKEEKQVTNETIIDDTSLKQSTRTLYFVKEENGEISKMFLVLLNGKTQKLKILTIPTSMKLTVSNSMYQKMKKTNVSIPQIIKLSMLNQYFNKEEAFDYGMKIFQEVFGISIDYYAVMNRAQYNEYFTENEDGVQIFLGKYLEISNDSVTTKDTKAILKEFYAELKANFPFERWIPYLETYEKISSDDMSFTVIPGERKNDSFVPEIESAKLMVIEFTNGI